MKGLVGELMVKKELTDKEIAATIFHKLRRRGIWGGKYKPYDSVKRWIEGKIKNDGKRVESILEGLIKEGLLLSHKGGETVSLNPKRKGDIINTIKKVLD